MDTGFEIVVSNFAVKLFIDFGIIMFLLKPVVICIFSYFFGYNSGTTKYFKNMILSQGKTSRSNSESR